MPPRSTRFVAPASLLLVASAAAILSSAGLASAQTCAKDLDCPGDLVCEVGQCVGQSGVGVMPGAVPGGTPGAAPGSAPGDARGVAPVATALPAPAGTPVKVEFLARTLSPLVTDVTSGQACTAPCSLQLPSGSRQVRIGAPERLSQELVIPATGGRFSVGEPDPGLEAASLVTGVPGVVGAGVGLALLIVGATSVPDEADSDSDTYQDDKESSDDLVMAGGILLIPAGALLITGLVLGGVNDTGLAQVAADTTLVPRIDGGPTVGGGFVGAATWDF